MDRRRHPASLVEYLDEHILQLVLDKLVEAVDRRSWRLVCKATYSLEVRSRKRVQLLTADLLQPVLRRYVNVDDLDLSFCVGIKDESIGYVAGTLADRLRCINMTGLSGLSNVALHELGRRCVRLVELDLSYCTGLGETIPVDLGSLSRLEKLSLVGCYGINDEDMGCLASACNKLRGLVLKGCIGITDAGLRMLSANCTQLISLDLTFTEVTDKGIKYLARLESLRTLILVSCSNLSNKSFASLEKKCKSLVELDMSRCFLSEVTLVNSKLRHLNLSRCSQLTEQGMVTFKNPNTIQSLKLDSCTLTEDALGYVAQGCKQLTELSLSKCRGVTDSGVEQICRSCTGLTNLDISCCTDLTERSLMVIATGCCSLRGLKIESCSMVTVTSISLLWQHCKLVEEVDATDTNLTQAGLELIGKCALLRVIKLAYCTLGDYGISRIGAGCGNLVYLDLYRCRAVRDAGVASISQGCKFLEVLNLSYCSEISDVSMSWIAQMSRLYQLEIRGCILVTSEGLRQVAVGCRLLVELDIKRCVRIDDVGVYALEHFCPYLKQINVSYCPVTDAGMMSLSRLLSMQNMKLVHLRNVSISCLGAALLQCVCLRKVKLLSFVKPLLPTATLQEVESRGCRVRWVDKPL